MKRLLLLLILLMCTVVLTLHAADKKMVRVYNRITKAWEAYPLVSIHDIQFIPQADLVTAENYQNEVGSHWTLQASHYLNDTVVVQGLVITPPANAENGYNGISYTAYGWTLLLHDPALVNTNEWAGVLLRVNTADSSDAKDNGFNSIEIGDIVQVTCIVQEFPGPADAGGPAMNSLTQLKPVIGHAFTIVSPGPHPMPVPTPVSVSDFYIGAYPGGTVKYSTGEKYEGGLVKLTDLVVNNPVNSSRGTFNMIDASGNTLSDYDASHYFTIMDGQNIPGDTSFHMPVQFAVVNYIQGAIWTSSGLENPRGYRICPLWTKDHPYPGYPGDLSLSTALPTIVSARRYPVTVTSADSVSVTVRSRMTPGGFPIARTVLLKSINYQPWVGDTMTMITTDSIYSADILADDGNPLPANTHVRYFFKNIDDHGNTNVLANGTTAFGRDTLKGMFFFDVLDRPLTIHDVQYTPYASGRSPYAMISSRAPYNTGFVTVRGVVTASTDDMRVDSVSGGAHAWFIQDGNAPWSGLWVRKRSTDTSHALNALVRGDSVTVSGWVDEDFDVTTLIDSTVTLEAHGRPVPAPVLLKTRYFKPGIANGDSVAEPYEDMLVRFADASITDSVPNYNDHREYSVMDSSGSPVKFRPDGLHTYSTLLSDTSFGKTIMFVGDSLPSVTGILYNSFARWVVDPRLNDDFVLGSLATYPSGWQIVSLPQRHAPSADYASDLIFPGTTPFGYAAGYYVAASMFPRAGFWIKFPTAAEGRTFRQHGQPITEDTTFVETGWNLVGALANSVSTAGITAYPPGNHLSKFFGYPGGSYTITPSLEPRYGYWVKSDSSGYYVTSSPGAMPKEREVNMHDAYNWIAITDKEGVTQTLYFVEDGDNHIQLRDYEMPPMFPQEGFSVCYSSGRLLETYGAAVGDGKEFGIDVNVANGPFTVSWAINTPKEAKRYTLVDAATKKVVNLAGTGSVKGFKAGARKLALQVNQGVALPREFSLSQNYPNPFNPATRVNVALPEQAKLQVTVYNILGQKVATLVDEVRDAGYHTVVWNGTTDNGLQVGTGVYFIRMSGQSVVPGSTMSAFTGIRKVLMLK